MIRTGAEYRDSSREIMTTKQNGEVNAIGNALPYSQDRDQDPGPDMLMHVIRETDASIVVRATLRPITGQGTTVG